MGRQTDSIEALSPMEQAWLATAQAFTIRIIKEGGHDLSCSTFDAESCANAARLPVGEDPAEYNQAFVELREEFEFRWNQQN